MALSGSGQPWWSLTAGAAPDVDAIGASYVTSDQLKLAGSADRLTAASGR